MRKKCEDIWGGRIKIVKRIKPVETTTSQGYITDSQVLFFNGERIDDAAERDFILKCYEKNREKFIPEFKSIEI